MPISADRLEAPAASWIGEYGLGRTTLAVKTGIA
jgi:hypothetical protein